ncbi:translation initiation factor IF-2 N-terminal domain-containing protein [Nostoc sp. DedSLP04]|uniref:translation initiation factor IF-2 N-terminal domain-containing protein n=1 Tax=Nostoc sp. DedSLP04 TaxID=3075401 RepID=UPI002AD4E931|nr:AAA domain-containing protein [Nostoc sp. DedSLP04]MDZ8033117.1 AAA domain-containing protein [Nostoc sp. DedSLP04]
MNNAQVRIYELSKELNLENKELLAICDQLNIVVKSYSSKISEFDAGRIRLAAKKYASTNGIQQELAITSHQPTSPKTISPNRLAPIHKQQILEINQPKILTNRPSKTPELSVTTSFQASCLNIKTDSEKWGYVFLGSSAINSLISNFESQVVLESYREPWQRQERANELIFDLLGQEPRLVYVRRKGAGQNPEEEIWDLTIATDRDDFQLPARLDKLGKTLGFIVVVQQNGRGGLKVLSAKLLELSQGNADGYTVPYYLRLLPNHQYRIDIPSTALARMAAMPICGDHLPTEDHLRIWEVFLQIEEKIAKTRQFCVPFFSHNGFGKRITFEIDVISATLDGSDENSLAVENFWERVKRAKNEEVKLFETTPKGQNWRNSRQLGIIEEVIPNSCIIRVRLERDLADYMAAGRYQLPATGFLFFEAVGDIQQIKRKKEALAQLRQGRTQNPYLGNFLFDASQARPIEKTVELQPKDLLLSSANHSQKAAVETVLAAEDLVLIQGPPGTGKTTVIAEICYQVALRGGRTLITSQANLAIDNALSRLVHNPLIRAVRKGNAERVGEQGQPFLENRVIGTWLENTATDCEKNLAKHLDNVRVLRELLAASQRFTAYLKVEEVFKKEQDLLQTRKANLESTCTTQKNEYNQAASQLAEVESLKTALEELLNQAPSVDWQDPALLNLWAGLNKYTSTDASLRNFAANLRLAINLASELGIVRPNHSLFGLAGWLQKTVVSRITEVSTALAYASDIAMAMTEAELAAQTYTQNSEYLARLKSNHQQLLANQQSLHQRIRNLHNRESEVSLAINDLDIWLSTANLNIANVLTQCLQNRQDFTVDLILLPSVLRSMTIADQYLPWQQSIDRCQLKVNELIPNYRQWDRVRSRVTEIRNLLVQGRNILNNRSIDEAAIWQVSVINTLDPVESLRKLKQLAQNSIDEIEKPLGVWGRIIEWILAFAVNQPSLDSIAQKLRPYSRRYGAAVTLEAIRRQAQIIRQRVQPVKSESAISQITEEVVNGIVTSARTWLKQLQTETEIEQNQLEVQLNEQMRLVANEQQKISANQEQLENYRSEADFKFQRAIALLQELFPFPYLPKELRLLVQEYLNNPSNILTKIPQFRAKIRDWENRTKQLDTLMSLIDPFATLSTSKDLLIVRITSLQETTETYKSQFIETQSQIQTIVEHLRQQLEYISTERIWWQSIWETIPGKFKLEVDSTDLFNLDFLRSIKVKFEYWQQQLQNEEFYLNRYQHFVQDWIAKLRQPTESGRNDLRRIYLDNANVVGITCVQAANYNFSQEFKYFDVVIIDEVSKCTPPELLIPALKAKKLVMVGDHRQLPPMLDTKTLEEVFQEIGSTNTELQLLQESLFKIQFKSANDSIKEMLNIQYRMHPIIMEAINQFYDGKLECGILEPDTKRAHNLAGEIIKKCHHLIWIKTPGSNKFQEETIGTSFFNIPEINAIEYLCKQFESTWASRVANGEPKKEIAVITFYGAQLRKIDERLQSKDFPSLQITTGTVDRFQGMERPVVIVSMVRNNSRGDVGFAKKPERVNVAFSRAQELLVIVGCHSLFTQQRGQVGGMYSNVSNIVRLHGGFIDVSRLFC